MKNILIITQDPLVNLRQTINGSGVSDNGKYKFYINDIDTLPDFIVVKGKGINEITTLGVPKSRTMLVTCEPYGILEYSKGYCEQFGTVLSCQPELKVSASSNTNVIYTPAVLPWFVGAIFQKDGTGKINMSREYIERANPPKNKFISVITSKKAFTKGHVDRLRFIKRLKERYGDEIEVFGNGFNSFEDKWDVLASYKYHIVIENSECDYYWTEKLADCYLAGTYPLYHGCSNIKDYFPEGAYTPININDFDSVVNIIEKIKKSDIYENCKTVLNKAKQKVLNEHNMFNIIANAIDTLNCPEEVGETVLKPASAFFSAHNLYLHTIEWNYYKLLSKYFI